MIGLMSLAVLAAGATPARPGPDIIVTGRALERDDEPELRDVVRLDRRAIEQVPSRRIEDVLQQVAGVQSFRRAGSRSAHPTAGGLTMRALGGNAASRALLIVDGVPQQDPFGGWVDFPAVLVDVAGRIVVTRGGGSVRWGPGALAGTVEIDSLAPGEASGIRAALRAGSRNAQDVRARWIGGSNRAYALAGAAFVRGDGFIPIVVSDRGAADIAAPYKQLAARVRAGIALGHALELQTGLSLLDDRRARGLRHSDNRTLAGDQSVRLVGHGATPFAITLYAQQRSFESRFAAADASRSTSRLTLDQYRVPSASQGARAELATGIGELTLRLGGDARFGSGKTREVFAYVGGNPTRRRIAGGDYATLGAFGEGLWRSGGVSLEGALRLDHWRLGRGKVREETLAGTLLRDDRSGVRTGVEPSVRLGASWTLAKSASLRGAVYRGWRLPTLNELYRPFRLGLDAVAANADLRPERLNGGEVGLGVSPVGEVTFAVTAFAARLDNAIANVMLGQGPGQFPGVGFVPSGGQYFQRHNLDSIDSRGVELDAAWRRGAFDARLSASWSRSRVRASGAAAALDGKPPPQTPAVTLVASGGWSGARGEQVGLNARYVSRQYEDDRAREPLRRALTVGGSLSWPITKKFMLQASVENLFDARVETAIGGDGAVERAEPRTLWIGVALR